MIELYKPTKHYEILKSWIAKRKGTHVILPPEFFPKIGFVSPGLAACFLYQTDSAFGLVENLISNPDADNLARFHGLNKVCEAVIQKAKSIGIKRLIATSEIEKVKHRIIDLGFIPVYRDTTVFMKEV